MVNIILMSHKKKATAPVASKASNDKKPDTSVHVHQKEKISKTLAVRERTDLTEVQKQIIEAALDKNVKAIILDGAPGVGKSYVSIFSGLQLLNQKKMGQLIYLRSLVQAKDGETGFLTGNLDEKTYYYNQPLYQALEELLPKNDIDYLIKDERIITYPTSMLRSYNFHNCVIISEESQNMSWESLFTIATRAGMYSKLFIIGDSVSQNDLGNKSGFNKFVDIFSDKESEEFGIKYFKMGSECIVRSPFVKFVVQKVEKYNELKTRGDWKPKST